MSVPVLALVVLAALASPAAAQPPDSSPDPVPGLIGRLELALRDGAPEKYLDLLAASADRATAEAFARVEFTPGVTRVVVRERDRADLKGTLPGDGYSVLVEVFVETGARARLATWRIDVRRGAAEAASGWGIVSQQALTTLHGLYRLGLNPRRQVAVKDLTVSAEDLTLTFPEAILFFAETETGPTGVVVLGRGEMSFSPAPETERSQLRVFTGAEALQSTVDAAFLRVHPSSFLSRLTAREMSERPAADPRDLKRADEIFRQDLGKSYCVDLGDLTSETWSLLPGSGDFLAEMRTRRYDTLTYARSANEIEDISVFDRRNRRNLSVYSSRAHLARYTRFYSDDDKADYVVHSYDLQVRYEPGRQRLEGSARLAVEVTAPFANTLTFKLADALEVKGVVSRELGRLLCVRIRDQNSIVLNLPSTLIKGYRLNLEVVYAGQIEPQPIDRESIELLASQETPQEEESEIPLEESHLFSNRSFWYPQAGVPGYSAAEIRVTLDEPWTAVASGQPVAATLAPGPVERGTRRREFSFSVTRPVRYLTLLVGRLAEVRRERVVVQDTDVEMRIVTHPRQRGRAKDIAGTAASVLRFYTSLVGPFPYPVLTVAAVERRLPGGHSPASLAVIAVQGPASRLRWTDDPGALPFPEFFISHELAHQWWGQAVGWKNYHEQWLSEGFAQYFAALYAERARGGAAFDAVLRRMQAWALDESDQGPIFLGYRIGHAKGDSRLFRAVVYNKGAMVLHMLRRLVGDEAFFGGLRRFYATWKQRKAGTDDFRQAMEAESGRDLTRFFDRWVLGEGVPQVTYSWRTDERPGASEVVVRLEQSGEIYDVPVSVTVEYEDNRVTTTRVSLTEQVTETRLPLNGRLRRVDVNRDRGAVGIFKQAAGS